MESTGFLEIKISGSKGNFGLSPENYDIREVIALLESAESLLYPVDRTNRPTISYEIKEGSVRHLFRTSLQFIIGFNAVMGQIAESESIDFLDLPSAKALESIQDIALRHDYVFNISTSVDPSNVLKIDKQTHFYRSETVWVEGEFYFYGKLTNAGGKDKANIHILTEDYGSLRIQTPISFLQSYNDNLLYKTFGIRAAGRQHAHTGEIDTSSLKFIELVDYTPDFNERYLNDLINRATKNWSEISDKDNWLREIRGTHET
jgi:hypothetical protein